MATQNPRSTRSSKLEPQSGYPRNKNLRKSKEISLIANIVNHPCFFNPKHKDYRNTLKRNELWAHIAERIGWSEMDCKCKWKALRDQYCRELKRETQNPNGTIKWKYFQSLDFLRPYALFRQNRKKESVIPLPNKSLSTEDEDALVNEYDSTIKTELRTTSISEHCSVDEVSDEYTESGLQSGASEIVRDNRIHIFYNTESCFEEGLIALVRTEEVLYNYKHPLFNYSKVKLEVWQNIAKRLNKTVRQCQLKWKSLRDQFFREHRRITLLDGGEQLPEIPRWKHYDGLLFLKHLIRTKSDQKSEMALTMSSQLFEDNQDESHELIESHTEDTIDDDLSNITEQHVIETAWDPRKNDKATETESEVDEIETFFRAVVMKIRKANIPPNVLTELQIEILKVINKTFQNG